MKILFSNLGYARGIDGSLWQHISRLGRHFYVSAPVQQRALLQAKEIIRTEQPDICCFVEIDKGSFYSAHINQMDVLSDDTYCHHDITNKYGDDYWLSKAPLHASKCNGFLAKTDVPFEKIYFRAGRKRLIYKLFLPGGIALYFAHFSLQADIRMRQFSELGQLILSDKNPSIVLADFNIFGGFSEVSGLLKNTGMRLLNRDDEPTFRFHQTRHILDLCLCSESLAGRIDLKIIPQPFSDHDALFLDLKD
jgi:endonuclease/exonuclease/phosphatase family metal-dependent hydrolase